LSLDKLSRPAVYRPYPTTERHLSQVTPLLNVTGRTHQHGIDDELSFLYLVGRVDLLRRRSGSGGRHGGSDDDDDAEESEDEEKPKAFNQTNVRCQLTWISRFRSLEFRFLLRSGVADVTGGNRK